MDEDLTALCGSCLTGFTAPKSLTGRKVRCPRCSSLFVVCPAPDGTTAWQALEASAVLNVPDTPERGVESRVPLELTPEEGERIFQEESSKRQGKTPTKTTEKPVAPKRQTNPNPQNAPLPAPDAVSQPPKPTHRAIERPASLPSRPRRMVRLALLVPLLIAAAFGASLGLFLRSSSKPLTDEEKLEKAKREEQAAKRDAEEAIKRKYRNAPESIRLALNALTRFQGKTEIGLYCAQYKEALGDTWGQVKVFVDSPEAMKYPEAEHDLRLAVANYQTADDAWHFSQELSVESSTRGFVADHIEKLGQSISHLTTRMDDVGVAQAVNSDITLLRVRGEQWDLPIATENGWYPPAFPSAQGTIGGSSQQRYEAQKIEFESRRNEYEAIEANLRDFLKQSEPAQQQAKVDVEAFWVKCLVLYHV